VRKPLGTPAPGFAAPSPVNPVFESSSLGGYFVLLVFLPPPSPERDDALAQIAARAHLLDDAKRLVFAVLPDAASFEGLSQTENCLRWFLDADGEISRMYGAVDQFGRPEPLVVAIDPSQRLLGYGPIHRTGGMLDRIAARGGPDDHAGTVLHAPVLIVPRVLEPEFCRQLIDAYEQDGGRPSGVMRVLDGKTVPVLDSFKSRRDVTLPDGPLVVQLRARLAQRLVPEVAKAFQFQATRIERYIVACYDADEGGYFLPHRDNTTPGTAHRRFAVSINLNAEDHEGGDLRFPEFGRRTYRPPTGGAVVFSCSLLHEATAVTRGRRYATLPFLYDEEGARIRAENRHSLQPSAPAPALAERPGEG
jgi:predicted 2-oxoglutarate/Fe(II)-dependent dioxygenase YbiX